MADLKQILAAAIEFERFGVEYYTKFHELVGDEKAKPLMKGLAGDEKEHANILERELKKLGG
jgi:rubrerythrin